MDLWASRPRRHFLANASSRITLNNSGAQSISPVVRQSEPHIDVLVEIGFELVICVHFLALAAFS
jgi:hypothetical protein